MYPIRIQRLAELMVAQGVDCVAVMPGSNLRYLAGVSFRLSERPTLAFFSAKARPAAVVPSFEVSRFTAGSASIDWQLFSWPDEAGPAAAFAGAASALGLTGKTLAIEENVLRVRELRLLEASAADVHFAPAEPILADMRIRKNAAEVAKMRQAVAITEEALEAVLLDIRVGMSERSIAERLTVELKRRGAEALAFDLAVVSGPNSALPHGQPSDRKVRAGDLLLFDFGVTVDGYASDITRTVAVGEVGAELRRVYDVVRQANEAGRAAARPGVEIQEVDRAARKVIVEAGFHQMIEPVGTAGSQCAGNLQDDLALGGVDLDPIDFRRRPAPEHMFQIAQRGRTLPGGRRLPANECESRQQNESKLCNHHRNPR